MPVDLTPIVLPIALLYFFVLYRVFRRKLAAGWVMLAITLSCYFAFELNTGVEIHHDEFMKYHIDSHYLNLTTSRADTITIGLECHPEVLASFHDVRDGKTEVSMVGIYDFGELRAYDLRTVNGVQMR